jgi:hypothetical protein
MAPPGSLVGVGRNPNPPEPLWNRLAELQSNPLDIAADDPTIARPLPPYLRSDRIGGGIPPA